MSSSTSAMATTLGLSKVFILDKYFSELQKFWETEKRLQGRERANFQQMTPRVGMQSRSPLVGCVEFLGFHENQCIALFS